MADDPRFFFFFEFKRITDSDDNISATIHKRFNIIRTQYECYMVYMICVNKISEI